MSTATTPVWQSEFKKPMDDIMFMHPEGAIELDNSPDAIRDVCRLQELGAIVPGIGSRFGDLYLPNIAIPPRFMDEPSFAAVTWDAAQAVYSSPSFSSTHLQETIGALWGPTYGAMDPPEHAKYRAVNQRGFTPKFVNAWEKDLVQPSLTGRFAEIKPRGKANLARDLTAFFPYEILGQIAGFDGADIAYVADCFHRINRAQIDPYESVKASVEIKAYALKLINERRREPREDFISTLARATIDGQPLGDEHFVAFVIHFMQGGIDTVFRMSNNIVHLLLTHPDQADKLKADRSLIPGAVEEAMRYEGVANILARLALEDTAVLDVEIPKGSLVHVVHPAVNRDPARWEDPHKFDVTRKPIQNMAFGYGIHRCVGMHLARLELVHFMNLIFDTMPNLRWDPTAGPAPKITGWFMRSCVDLPVVWDVQ